MFVRGVGVYTVFMSILSESLGNSSNSSRKQMVRDILGNFIKKILELPHQGDSNEYTQHTIIL